MSCQICGKNSCSKSFHSLTEQEAHEEATEKAIEALKARLINKINRSSFWIDKDGEDVEVLHLDDVLNIINNE
jgi:hypothetical protein